MLNIHGGSKLKESRGNSANVSRVVEMEVKIGSTSCSPKTLRGKDVNDIGSAQLPNHCFLNDIDGNVKGLFDYCVTNGSRLFSNESKSASSSGSFDAEGRFLKPPIIPKHWTKKLTITIANTNRYCVALARKKKKQKLWEKATRFDHKSSGEVLSKPYIHLIFLTTKTIK